LVINRHTDRPPLCAAEFDQWAWWAAERAYLRNEAACLKASVEGAVDAILDAASRAIVAREQQALWHQVCRRGCAVWIQAHARGWLVRLEVARWKWAVGIIQRVHRGRSTRLQLLVRKPGRGRHCVPRLEHRSLVPGGSKVLMRRVTGGEAEAAMARGEVLQPAAPEEKDAKKAPDGHGRAFRSEMRKQCSRLCDSCVHPGREGADAALESSLRWLCACVSVPEPEAPPPSRRRRQRPATAAPAVAPPPAARPSTADPTSGTRALIRPGTAGPNRSSMGLTARPATAGLVRNDESTADVDADQSHPRTHSDEVARRVRDIVDSGVAGHLFGLLTAAPPSELTPEEERRGLTPEEAAKRALEFDRPLHAAWLVTNLAAISPEQTAVLCNCAGGGDALVYALLSLMRGSHADRAEQAVWALANLVAGGVGLRDSLLQADGLSAFTSHIHEAAARGSGSHAALFGVRIAGDLWPPHWARRAAVGLATLCGGNPVPPWEMVASSLPLWACVESDHF